MNKEPSKLSFLIGLMDGLDFFLRFQLAGSHVSQPPAIGRPRLRYTVEFALRWCSRNIEITTVVDCQG